MKKNVKEVFKLLIILFATYHLPFNLRAQDAGKSGLAFLKIGVGSRGVAMGEAYSALVDEPTAIYWNPAGLAAVRGVHLSFTHLNWLQNINHEFAAVVFPGFGGTLGLGVTFQTIPDIQLRTKPTAEPVGTFDTQDVAVALAYGRQWHPRLAGGFTLKYLYEKLYTFSASGFAVDLGGIWQTPVSPLRLGLSLQNLGTMNALQKEEIKLPASVRLGGAYVWPFAAGESQLALTGDYFHFLEGGDGSSLGGELRFRRALALRGGFQFGRENRGLTAGFGTAFGRYQLDYGYAPFGNDLGNTHRFSIEVRL